MINDYIWRTVWQPNSRGTDNLILAGHVEGDSATLEVYVYNDVEDALYVHHDLLLPSLPLALGNFQNLNLAPALILHFDFSVIWISWTSRAYAVFLWEYSILQNISLIPFFYEE